MIGETVDNRYQIEALVGRGGMGAVYRATDQTDNRVVALKFLNLFLNIQTDSALKRFHREFRTLAQLDHPRVVQAYSYGTFKNTPYLVLEFLEGRTLGQELKGKPLDRAYLLQISRQICDALSYIHTRNIVHRDLKPGNLMLRSPDNAPQIKLMDFGLVRDGNLSMQLTQEGVALGTMAYIAPEQAQGIPVDFRADLYALGIILYEMAVGRPPFVHENPAVMLMNQLTMPPPRPRRFNPGIDEPLEQLILQLLDKEPAQRPTSTEQLANKLARLNNEAPTLVKTPCNRADLIPRVPLIGRDVPLGQLNRQWTQAQAGSGQVALLSGMAGAGKSRLITEARLQNHISGNKFLHGHCREHTALPYHPLLDILDRLAKKLSPARQKTLPVELARLLPGISATASKDTGPAQPVETKLRLFAACWDFLRQSAQDSALMIAIEDVQWADPTLLELLTYLANQISNANILLILSYRPEEVDPAAATKTSLPTHSLQGLQHIPAVRAISLTMLTRNQTDKFLQMALGSHTLPNNLADNFYQATGGNPLFIEETLKALAEEGHVAQWAKQDSSQIRRISISSVTMQLPKNVLALAERRLRQLSTEDKAILTSAAVLGPKFSFSLLETVTRLAEDPLLDALDRLLAARLIEELPVQADDDYYGFVQEALRQALLNTISRRRLRRLHQRTGEAIQQVFNTSQPRYWPMLAYHYAQAGQSLQALKYFMLAGDAAARLYANAEAIACYDHALEIATNAPPPQAKDTEQLIHLFTRRGRCFELDNQFENAMQGYKDMETLAQQQVNRPLKLAALIAQSVLLSTPTPMQDIKQGEQLSRQAVTLAQELGNRQAEAKALWTLMLVYRNTKRPHEAIQCGEQSLAIARQLNNREQIAYTLNDIAWAYLTVNRIEKTRQSLNQAGELWRELGNLPMLVDNLNSAAGHYFLTGEPEQALSIAGETLQISKRIGNLWNHSQAKSLVGYINMFYGNLDVAVTTLEAAIKISEEGNLAYIRVAVCADLGWLYGTLGNIARGFEMIERARQTPRAQAPNWQVHTSAVLTRLHLLNGDIAAAQASLAECRADMTTFKMAVSIAYVWSILAEGEFALATKDYSRLLNTMDDFAATQESYNIRLFNTDILYLKGMALMDLDQYDEAYTVFLQARTAAEKIKSRLGLWPVLHQLSQLETQRGNPTQAQHLQQQARQIIQYIIDHTPTRQKNIFLATPLVRQVMEE